MSKYIGIFFLALMASVFLIYLFAEVFKGGTYAETAVYMFGATIIILLSFLISLIFYLISLIKSKKWWTFPKWTRGYQVRVIDSHEMERNDEY